MSASRHIDEIRHAWRSHISAAPLVSAVALLVFGATALAHLGRLGTLPTRSAAAVAFGGLVAALSWRAFRARATLRNDDATLARIVGASEPAIAARALRAARLIAEMRDRRDGTSPALAAEHFDRVVLSASIQAVAAAASGQAHRWRWVGMLSALGAVFATIGEPVRVFEGLDVALARGGRAPWAIHWLEGISVEARQPAYLRVGVHSLGFNSIAVLPVGTEVVVRGRPLHAGRNLVLTDGVAEVPFADDGQGLLVARWMVRRNGGLHIGARFGEVLVPDPGLLDTRAISDAAPIVQLEGAPNVIRISEMARLDLKWAAADDHGLRQVDLVLRSGEREDRRNLGHFDGETRAEQGGHALTPRDAFLRGAFLPVEVGIEARDNDPLSSEKWGKSAVITLIPPAVGEAEARRFESLLDSRRELTRLLDLQLQQQRLAANDGGAGSNGVAGRGGIAGKGGASTAAPGHSSTADGESAAEALEERIVEARAKVLELAEKVEQTYSGLSTSRGMQNFANAILQPMRQPSKKRVERLDETRRVLLALDAALSSMSNRDAATVSKQLAEVAEAAAHAAHLARETEKRDLGLTRLDQAVDALSEGSKQLQVLGNLGRDLGSVAHAGIDRILRVRRLDDLFHTEQAALFLAARLRRPNSSFTSSGGGGGGTESGAGTPQPGGGEPTSDAESRFDEIAEQLRQLAQEHSGQMGQVEQTIRDAEDAVESEADRDEARMRADETRQAVNDLPRPGERPGTARATAALAREHAIAMAEAMEKLEFRRAVESGERALEALEGALRAQDLTSELRGELERARGVLEQHLDWSREQLRRMRAAAEAQAKEALKQLGVAEGDLSKQAEELLKHGGQDSLLPRDALDRLERAMELMKQAAGELERGRGEKGLELQEAAQRLLEQADTGKTSDPSDGDGQTPPRGRDGNGRSRPGEGGDVPDEDRKNKAEEFRKRVVEGLGKRSGGKLAPVIRDYAEGLLR